MNEEELIELGLRREIDMYIPRNVWEDTPEMPPMNVQGSGYGRLRTIQALNREQEAYLPPVNIPRSDASIIESFLLSIEHGR